MLFDEAKSRGLATAKLYTAMLHLYSLRMLPEHVETLFKEMKREGSSSQFLTLISIRIPTG